LTKDKATRRDQNGVLTGEGGDNTEKEPRFSGDSFWKDLVAEYFYPLLKRALPELYADADINAKPKFLDKEFTDVLKTSDPQAHKSPHFADFVVEVPLKDGSGKWIICHIESQGQNKGDLAERMFFYMCVIYAHYRRVPAALAIVAYKPSANESPRYSHMRYGTRIDYGYNGLVLLELDDEELIASDNPIDIVLYAAKYALKSRQELQKYNYLRKATELLAERGWDMEEKRRLMLFMERIMNLKDEKMKVKYWEYQEQLDKEGKIVYVSIAEEYYTKKGIEKGRLEGKLEVARNLLADGVSPEVIVRNTELPIEKIRELMH
jgi:predicted transposase/invertase (TIGR01784 family)